MEAVALSSSPCVNVNLTLRLFDIRIEEDLGILEACQYSRTALQHRYPCFDIEKLDLNDKFFYPVVLHDHPRSYQQRAVGDFRLHALLRVMWVLSDDRTYADKVELLRLVLTQRFQLVNPSDQSGIFWRAYSLFLDSSLDFFKSVAGRSGEFARTLWERHLAPALLLSDSEAVPSLAQHRLANTLLLNLYDCGYKQEQLGEEAFQAWVDERFRAPLESAGGACDLLEAVSQQHKLSARDSAAEGDALERLRNEFSALAKKLESLPCSGWQGLHQMPPAFRDIFVGNVDADIRYVLLHCQLHDAPQQLDPGWSTEELLTVQVQWIESSDVIALRLQEAGRYQGAIDLYSGGSLKQYVVELVAVISRGIVGQQAPARRPTGWLYREASQNTRLMWLQSILWTECSDGLFAHKTAVLNKALPAYLMVHLFHRAQYGVAIPLAQSLNVDVCPLLADTARKLAREDVLGFAERVIRCGRKPTGDDHARLNGLIGVVCDNEWAHYAAFMLRGVDVQATSLHLMLKDLRPPEAAQQGQAMQRTARNLVTGPAVCSLPWELVLRVARTVIESSSLHSHRAKSDKIRALPTLNK